MTDSQTALPFDEDANMLINCRTQHQQWNQALMKHEQDINQLVSLLTDLLAQHNSSRLRPRAIQYVTRFNRLKSQLRRLRLDMICSGSACFPTEHPICAEPHAGFYTGLDLSMHRLSDEFSTLSTGCYQFLSVLVSLNLL
ncbi:hypothetical protein [Spirosoma rhododendri]|uniref:Uncharacterized protein n=1 Tax=Spirosoma rhododendri TaxID=2728024 RepID=A0A7L5DWE7_9BACT|nr:hypothetical protein [Spirosoma rhododendri]QJD79870.1 hypothetical protein HH216_16695 [Spirosoma rhododendri]